MLWLVEKDPFRKKGAWDGFSLQRKEKIQYFMLKAIPEEVDEDHVRFSNPA